MSFWVAVVGWFAMLWVTPAFAQERIPDGPGCTYSGLPDGAAWAFKSDPRPRRPSTASCA